jgi:acetyl esterase/lipase
MAGFGFFQYLRLKLVVVLFRAIAGWRQRSIFRLAEKSERTFVRIPSRDHGRFVEGWIYTPPGRIRADAGPRPVLVNWHGGGYTMPNLGLDDVFCTRITRECNILVLDADYRKGPEAPFPAAVHDAEDTLRWLESKPDMFDLKHIAVSGFSSGGNLALVAASLPRDKFPTLDLRAVVAFYPGTDLSADTESKIVAHPLKPIPAAILRIFYDSYVPDMTLRKDPRVSPAFADPASFPDSVTIMTCSGDILSPEAIALAEKLDDGRRKVTALTLEGTAHGFDKDCVEGSFESGQRDVAYSTAISTLMEALVSPASGR